MPISKRPKIRNNINTKNIKKYFFELIKIYSDISRFLARR